MNAAVVVARVSATHAMMIESQMIDDETTRMIYLSSKLACSFASITINIY